ncbi:MAG: LEA type 2 family protein [Polyangiaceae bacterium]|nr:LEA type 2 family protein [Polyangiaceae bacterium]
MRSIPALFTLVAALGLSSAACVKKPTMKLRGADIAGIQIGFPVINVNMVAVMDVTNPNSYDVAIRRVRGQVVFANRYPLPVDFQAQGNGLWLPSGQTTRVGVPITIPLALGFTLLNEAAQAPVIPFRFQGKADVTGTRTLQLEKDDYAIDETGVITRQQLVGALPGAH